MRKKTEAQRATDKAIGERLRSFRKRSDIKQDAIALILKVEKNTIGTYESGKTTIDPEYLRMIIEHYNLRSDYFDINTNNTTDNSNLKRHDRTAGPEVSNEAMSLYRDIGIEQMKSMVFDMKAQINKLLDTISSQSISIQSLSFAERERAIESTLKTEHIKTLGRIIENLSKKDAPSEQKHDLGEAI